MAENKLLKRLFLIDDGDSEDFGSIQELNNKIKDSSIGEDEKKAALSKLEELRSKKIQPFFDKDKDIASIHYGGIDFRTGKQEPLDVDKLEPVYEKLPAQKKQPLIVEPIKQEIKDIELVDRKPKNPIEFEPIESNEPTKLYAGGDISSRSKGIRMEGEEEPSQSTSILDKLLKKERELTPDVQVRKQVWNPELSTYELSQEKETARPFTDKIFGSPESRAAEKTEQYSQLMLDEAQRAKQVDASGKRMIAKSPLLESFERYLQIKPEEGRQIASVANAPVENGTPVVPEIKSVKQQKSTPVAKSTVSSGVGEKESTEAKLSEAIKAESEQVKKPEMDFNELLRMAQESRDKSQLLANIGKASELFATGLTGVVPGGKVTKPVAQEFYDKLIKQAGQPVEDIGDMYTMKTKQDEMQRLSRRRDPNSEESKFARDLLAQQGIKVPEAATAEALEKYAPQLTNILNQREAREARAASARERALDRATILESKLEGKKLDAALRLAPKIQNKQFETLSEIRSQSALMKESLKNPNPTRDVAIIYGFVKSLDPKSAVREGEIDFVQLGRSVPTKINQYFKRAFTGEILPEQARKEMADYISQREKQAYKEWDLSAGPYLRQADKAGIDRELVAPGSTEMESPIEEQKKTDPKIKEYAEKNSISYDQAENILKARGYGK